MLTIHNTVVIGKVLYTDEPATSVTSRYNVRIGSVTRIVGSYKTRSHVRLLPVGQLYFFSAAAVVSTPALTVNRNTDAK